MSRLVSFRYEPHRIENYQKPHCTSFPNIFVSAIFASRIANCARQITCAMTAFVSINSSNQRFFLKFAKHAQSVRCIFCNYCANILRFCFLSRVFLLRWPIIRTCGIQKRLKLRSLLLSADGKWWRCSRLTSSWLHFRARACGPSGIFSILCYEYEIRDLSICIRDYVPASAIVITSSTLKYLTFLNIHASLALLSENNFYVRAPQARIQTVAKVARATVRFFAPRIFRGSPLLDTGLNI
jgi:hypothetical protein